MDDGHHRGEMTLTDVLPPDGDPDALFDAFSG